MNGITAFTTNATVRFDAFIHNVPKVFLKQSTEVGKRCI